MFFSLHSMTCSISSLGGDYVRKGFCPTENRRGFCPGGLLSGGLLSGGILSRGGFVLDSDFTNWLDCTLKICSACLGICEDGRYGLRTHLTRLCLFWDTMFVYRLAIIHRGLIFTDAYK